MINRRFNKLNTKNKNIIYLISTLLIFITIGIINVAYSKYGSNYEMKINTASGEMIIDAVVDDNETYLENGLRYFTLTVSNHKDNKVTSANIDYKITIKNQEGLNNGRFHYVDSNGNTNTELNGFQKELVIDNYSFTTNQETIMFKIYIMTDSGLTEDVKYEIILDAVQKEMK
ncbi:MAG: hypothetical protein ACI4WW_00125 [Candidatus Coprovivens sp.]